MHRHTYIDLYPASWLWSPPSLCISYELSEETQWIQWQRSKARPSNRPRWRGDGLLCVYECMCVYILTVCVFDSHSGQSGRDIQVNMVLMMDVCFHNVKCFSPYKALSHILLHELSIYACRRTQTHTLLHSSSLWSVVGGGVKWQVFNQRWPPHAMELICWTCLNPRPLPFHLIHPLTGTGCDTQVTLIFDSLTNSMREVEGGRRPENKKKLSIWSVWVMCKLFYADFKTLRKFNEV